MKKSDLNNFIKENIIETLSEVDVDVPLAKITTQKANAKITNAQGFAQFILKTWNDISDEENDSVTAIQDLKIAKAKLEKVSKAEPTGIEEDATPKGEDFTYDYEDIGQFYLEGFGKEHTLNNDQLRMLGKKIVDQLYGGDIGKAYDAVVNPNKNPYDIKEANVGLAEIEEMGYNNGEDAFEKIKGRFKNRIDHLAYRKGFFQGFTDSASSYGLNENEDAEPTKSDIKKTKGLAKAKEELALLTREMKSLAKKYSKAEGADKEKLVKILKDKTKLKKELENILDKKKI